MAGKIPNVNKLQKVHFGFEVKAIYRVLSSLWMEVTPNQIC